MKNAILLIETNQIKVVLGNVLTTIKVNELNLTHNVSFFDQLFKETNVYCVQEISQMTREQIDNLSPVGTPISDEEKKVIKNIDRPVSSKPTIQTKKDNDEVDFWIKTTTDTALIIDDLYTGRQIRGGIEECLSVPHGRAINLAMIDPDKVRQSRILKRLLENGSIIRCSKQEAMQMESTYKAHLAKRKAKPISSSDGGGVEIEIGEGGRRRHIISDDNDNDLDLTNDVRSYKRSSLDNEDSGTMSELMEALDQEGARPQRRHHG